ncbi:hypothetical protein HDU86_003456 [Geranomyces michiganensis]|nr:hypothetical protein HDU86_003456 [Geranomyces michiganensis]
MDVDEAGEPANGGSETTTENGDDPMEDVLPTEDQLDRTGTPPLGASASQVLHIETRGRQTYEDILFLASDVSMKMLNNTLDTLRKWIAHPTSRFVRGEHYHCLRVDAMPTLFLAWLGLTYALNNSRSPFAEFFVKQAARIVFWVQMGTPEERAQKISKMGLKTVVVPCYSFSVLSVTSKMQTRCQTSYPSVNGVPVSNLDGDAGHVRNLGPIF